MDVAEFAHVLGEIGGGPAVGDLHLAPGTVGIDGNEEIGGAVAPILAIEALQLTGLGGDRWANLADELDRALVEADDWALRIWSLCIEVEHVLHPSDIFGIDLRDAPHVLAPGPQIVLGD